MSQNHLYLPFRFALAAHSETSSWARPSVNTMEIRGTFAENGLAPSVSVKLLSNICFRASPVMEPRPMYFICDTAFFMSLAELNCFNVNSVRTSVEYWSKPTRAALGEISSASKIPKTNCFTISKLSSPRLFDPSITNTRSTGPSVHAVKWAQCPDHEKTPQSRKTDLDSQGLYKLRDHLQYFVPGSANLASVSKDVVYSLYQKWRVCLWLRV